MTGIATDSTTCTAAQIEQWAANEEIKIFREYLRIPSVHPDIDYEPVVQFLRRQAADLGLPVQVHAAGGQPQKPVVVISWPGREPQLKSIALNSHMDVVPVYRESWTHDPFAADLDEEGRIFARGTQDMKCNSTQYLGAIRALQRDGFQPQRTLHLLFVPDEEIGGVYGMLAFTKSAEFRALNIGFVLDEGVTSTGDEFHVFYAERPAWFLHIHCPGTTGHGSALHRDTAGEKVASILGNFLRYRQAEVAKLAANPALTVGDVTTINLTILQGGVQVNVVPTSMRLSFDIRLAVEVQHEDFENMLLGWCAEAGNDVTIEYDFKTPPVEPTKLDATNVFWTAFKKAAATLNLRVVPSVSEGATDSSFLREMGIPAIGFSPINNTPVRLHDNDEFLRADTYLRGIQIYKQILEDLSQA